VNALLDERGERRGIDLRIAPKFVYGKFASPSVHDLDPAVSGGRQKIVNGGNTGSYLFGALNILFEFPEIPRRSVPYGFFGRYLDSPARFHASAGLIR